MHLVDKYRERRNLSYRISKLIGYRQLATLVIRQEREFLAVLVPSVENHLLGIGHCHQAHHRPILQVLVHLAGIRVLDKVAIPGALLLIQHLKLHQPLQTCRRCLGKQPGDIEVLNAPKARDDARLQARRSQYQKVVRPYRVHRLVLGKVEVDVDEGSHQIGLARSHRKAEEVIGISYLVENILQHLLTVYLSRMMTNELLQLRGYLLAVAVFLPAILIESQRRRVLHHRLASLGIDFLGIHVGDIKHTLGKQLPQRLPLASYLEIQISLDGINLGIAHHAPLADIADEVAHGTVGRLVPQVSFVLYKWIEHSSF